MFTGLIQHVGTIHSRFDRPEATRMEIAAQDWDHLPEPGASIAVNGCCLTVVSTGEHLAFDMIPVTLERTTLGSLGIGSGVNLEHAATPETLLGGHLVQGHVDGVGEVVANGTDADGGWRLRILAPEPIPDYLIEKGSIAIEGVSLTIAECSGNRLEVALIPETLQRTTLGGLQAGDPVNLEADCLSKMVGTLLERRGLVTPAANAPES